MLSKCRTLALVPSGKDKKLKVITDCLFRMGKRKNYYSWARETSGRTLGYG